jgi:hypothetical protein
MDKVWKKHGIARSFSGILEMVTDAYQSYSGL